MQEQEELPYEIEIAKWIWQVHNLMETIDVQTSKYITIYLVNKYLFSTYLPCTGHDAKNQIPSLMELTFKLRKQVVNGWIWKKKMIDMYEKKEFNPRKKMKRELWSVVELIVTEGVVMESPVIGQHRLILEE